MLWLPLPLQAIGIAFVFYIAFWMPIPEGKSKWRK